MARTRQTARKSTGGKAPRKIKMKANFYDQSGTTETLKANTSDDEKEEQTLNYVVKVSQGEVDEETGFTSAPKEKGARVMARFGTLKEANDFVKGYVQRPSPTSWDHFVVQKNRLGFVRVCTVEKKEQNMVWSAEEVEWVTANGFESEGEEVKKEKEGEEVKEEEEKKADY
eukprot:TRINITY_DN7235_c0_g1_i1.p2 TRINITY_DN7235_c0_g1~~TRINITY_DN7235_c0_g1_i1.p2  ORF type:complete len:179 (+),score=73.42 TRINITY_DN7235_c0_g1_i1:25-537(+)